MDNAARQQTIEKLNKGGDAFRQQLTPEERSTRSAHAGAGNTDLSVRRQWESIRNTPGKLEATRLQRGRTTKAVWDSLTPEQRDARIKKILGNRGRSVACDAFLQTLRDQGLIIKAEQTINGFVVDGLIVTSKTILEFYGDFWHCRPTQYKDPQQFCSWLGRTVGQQWARDRKRLGVFYSLGYKVVIVWESDWKLDQESQIVRILQAV
jgi:G:T-mismatch repair DNA endonuclease (very short patch repair protein)